jgi:ribosomal-protein-alanine N-acetyltransferase
VNDYALKGSIFWVITLRDDDTAIGECCLWNFDPGFHCAEIGYEMQAGYWNKGLMSEALSEVLAYGFLEMGLHRIEASPFADNVRSQKLLLKLGFKLEGTLRERHFFHGRFLDQQYYGLLAEEWKDRKTGL